MKVISLTLTVPLHTNNVLTGYFIMAIGGQEENPPPTGPLSLEDVELVAIDPTLHPVPNCLTQLNPLPHSLYDAAGAIDYSGKLTLVVNIQCFISLLCASSLLRTTFPFPLYATPPNQHNIFKIRGILDYICME